MGTFLERVDGSSRILKPGQEVKLAPTDKDGKMQGEATFSVKESALFHVFGKVRRTGREFVVVLGGKVLPWESSNGDSKRPYNNDCAVWGQGVTIKYKPTGERVEVIYVRD